MLLYQHGYTKGMLGTKIQEFLEDETDPPAWGSRVDPDYLTALSKIGNGALHSNDGDIGRQKEIDVELLLLLRSIFEELMDTVYEQPAREQARKAKLTAASESVKKR
jgi:hypothetical protein